MIALAEATLRLKSLVDANAPKESNEELVRVWCEETERRTARVRSGAPAGEDVFARIDAKLASR